MLIICKYVIMYENICIKKPKWVQRLKLNKQVDIVRFGHTILHNFVIRLCIPEHDMGYYTLIPWGSHILVRVIGYRTKWNYIINISIHTSGHELALIPIEKAWAQQPSRYCPLWAHKPSWFVIGLSNPKCST